MLNRERVKEIDVMSVSIGDRHLPPTESGIGKMMKALGDVGQLQPIVVSHVTHNSYRIIIGATRFEAAKRLHWKKILAIIANGSAADIEIAELMENIERRELTDKQRHDMRERVTELQQQMLEDVELSKGGRGKEGGMSKAAKEAGIPRETARRRHKAAHNIQNGQVSRMANPLIKTSIHLSQSELNHLEAWRAIHQKGASRTECIRKIIREYLKEHFTQRDNCPKSTEKEALQ